MVSIRDISKGDEVSMNEQQIAGITPDLQGKGRVSGTQRIVVV